MKLNIFLLTLSLGFTFSQVQQPIAVGGGSLAARPPGAAAAPPVAAGNPAASPPSGGSAAAPPAAAAPPPSGGGAAARPPSGGSAAAPPVAAAPPTSGGGAAARPPSGGSAAAPPAAAAPVSGGGAAAQPPSGGSAAAPPPSGGGAAARPPIGGSAAAPPVSGGSAAAPPPSGGGAAAQPPSDDDTGTAVINQDTYSCPGDNQKRYRTGGVTFELKCGQGTTAKRIQSQPATSLKQCADLCAADPKCQSADFNAGLGSCATFSEYIPTIPYTGVSTWFPIEERKNTPVVASPYCPVDKPIPGIEALAGNHTTKTDCPGEADGKLFTTSGGLDFRISCFHHKNTGQVLESTAQPTFEACMNHCEQTPGCRSVSYAPRYPNLQDRQCKLLGDAADDATVCTPSYANVPPNHDFAIIVDPPYVEAPPEEPTARCSTECPGAHGKIYTTESGETFRTECCKRYGTKPLAKVYASSNLECMEKCSAVTSCSSSEFQIASGSCFLGDRHSPPSLNATAWASSYSLGCAGACKACKDCSKQTLLGGPETSVLGAA